jgi:hypothetical protein
MEPHRHAAAVAQILGWLTQADQSRASRKPVLAGAIAPVPRFQPSFSLFSTRTWLELAIPAR